jgi:predicted O-linked N-acetylglucosamine transferase (SPINDLY family)
MVREAAGDAPGDGRRAMNSIEIRETLSLGIQHHQAGRLADAEAAYRKVLAVEPNQADALHLLGIIASQTNNPQIAIDLFRRAVALAPYAAAYRNSLGLLLSQQGETEAAIAELNEAIRLDPRLAEAHNNLGLALKDLGRLDEAEAAHRRAVALNPNLPQAYYALGNLLCQMRQRADAAGAYASAVKLAPGYFEAQNNLGVMLQELGDNDGAEAAYRRALQLRPNASETYNNLGNVLLMKEMPQAAVEALNKAIELAPGNAQAHLNLGNALYRLRRNDEAIEAYRAAAALRPDHAETQNNLGSALAVAGDFGQAIEAYRRAIDLVPDYADGWKNLAGALKDTGQLDESLVAYRKAIEVQPTNSQIFSDYIFALHYHPDFSAEAIYSELRRWNENFAEPLKRLHRTHRNSKVFNRKLKVGYISPDLYAHSVARFLLPLLIQHDRSQVESFCYADVQNPDYFTEKLRLRANNWRQIAGWSDEKVVQQILGDRIDVMVDLAGQTARNRLTVLARQVAPVQIFWLAYAGSTGIDAMNYRLSDPYLDPPETDLSVYSEKTLYLPNTFWCYQPIDDSPAPGALPAARKGYVTFASLNNFCKASAPTLWAWCQILKRVKDSHLLLHAGEGGHRQRLERLFADQGIDPRRIEFLGRLPVLEYLKTHQQIDIALDTFPYNGGTTSLDALYMGVPVVTLVGRTAVGRAGASLLTNVGHHELIARSIDQYTNLAVELAADLPRLIELRSSLRDAMRRSPLMDAPQFTFDMESVYRYTFQAWCVGAR